MFSNRSVKLFTLKNCFLMTVKTLHSIRMWLTVQVVWQVKHCGCGSCFSMKEWISLVWPMHNQDIITYSLLDFLKAGLHSPKVGWIWKSLLWMLLFHLCCHFVWRNLLIVGFKSVYRMEITSGLRSNAILVAESALSFPLTPMIIWDFIKKLTDKNIDDPVNHLSQGNKCLKWKTYNNLITENFVQVSSTKNYSN